MIFVVYDSQLGGDKVLVGAFLLKSDALQFMGLPGNGNLELSEVDGQWEHWKKIREAA